MTNALWRVFVPTWRFFDRVGPRPRLFARARAEDEWQLIERPLVRNWRSLVFAPENGLVHADHNLLERLLAEIADGLDVAHSVTWRLVERRAARALGIETFQVKVVAAGEDVVYSADSRA